MLPIRCRSRRFARRWLIPFLAAFSSGSADPPVTGARDSALVDIGVPVLRDWIIQSRDEALAQGVQRIPQGVRSQLSCYVPEGILNGVRWRAGDAGELTLQMGAFYLARTSAITLDYVVVFLREADALHNVELWLHELKHVMQYEEWGIEGFAERYLQNYSEIESDASRYRWEWVLGPARQKGPC